MEEEEGSGGDAASSSALCLCDNKVITASKKIIRLGRSVHVRHNYN